MEKPMRARKRKLETDKVDLKPLFKETGGQGVHREVESEGHEEKYRAVIDGGYPEDEPVGQTVETGRARTIGAKAFLIRSTKPRCLRAARYGRQRVTLGELEKFAGGTAISEPISVSEGASEAEPVVRRPE
jgi:hypothetical protein